MIIAIVIVDFPLLEWKPHENGVLCLVYCYIPSVYNCAWHMVSTCKYILNEWMNPSYGTCLGEAAEWSQTLWSSLAPRFSKPGSLVFLWSCELPYSLPIHSQFCLRYSESFLIAYSQRPPAETATYRNVSLRSGALCCQYQWRTKGAWSEMWSLWVVEICTAMMTNTILSLFAKILAFLGHLRGLWGYYPVGYLKTRQSWEKETWRLLQLLLIWQGLRVSRHTVPCTWLLSVSRVITHVWRVVVILSWEQKSMTCILDA